MPILKPGQKFPEITLPKVGGGKLSLSADDTRSFLLVIIYRGLHCPKCKEQLTEVQASLDNLTDTGISVVAASMDGKERGEQTRSKWNIDQFDIGYDLSRGAAEQMGLFLSTAEFEQEPELFAEPAMFLVQPDNSLYAAWVQSSPFARPQLNDIISAVKFVTEKDYPARGTFDS